MRHGARVKNLRQKPLDDGDSTDSEEGSDYSTDSEEEESESEEINNRPSYRRYNEKGEWDEDGMYRAVKFKDGTTMRQSMAPM